MSAPDREK